MVVQLRADEWFVADIEPDVAKTLVRTWHYAKGGSHTGVFFHGLFNKFVDEPLGVAQWLPPTRVAAESVNKERWRQVIALSRLVVSPIAPSNACSFILAASERLIRHDGRFVTLLTYADESQGHLGAIYRAANWTYLGRTNSAAPRWIDPRTGRQVATQATKTRTKQQMLDLGLINTGRYFKHKYVKHLKPLPQRKSFAEYFFRDI